MNSHSQFFLFVTMVMVLVGLGLGCSRSGPASNSNNISSNNNMVNNNANDVTDSNNNNIYNTPETTAQSLQNERVNVQFHLYLTLQDEFIFTNSMADQILAGKFNPSLKTIIIIHGYLEHGNRNWIVRMVEEILKKERTNLIVADWYRGATNWNYFRSADNTQVVGAAVAQLMEELRFLGANPSTFHLVGYSLGAHAAGYAGSLFQGVGRITGLDPARAAFENSPEAVRLDPTDALFVDVIHSDGEPGIGMGAMQPMGHVDFYLNERMKQPGCPSGVFDRVWEVATKFDFTAESIKRAVTCSHARSHQILTSTINNDCPRIQQQCSTIWDLYEENCVPCGFGACPNFGYSLDPRYVTRTQQLYIVQTSSEWPYCCK